MASTYQRGMATEKKAVNILKKEGWLVERKNWSKWLSKDFYRLFDILAVKGKEVKLVQVKSNRSHTYRAKKEIKLWKEINSVQVPCEVWLWSKETRQFKIDIV